MGKIRWPAVWLLLLAILVIPVVLSQLLPQDQRSFSGVWLDDLEFREIAFRNQTQNLDLKGLLFIPSGDGPFPAAVIIHGSGTSVRNNAWYLTLVEHLQREGITVLLPDKRGSESSAGDWRTSSYEDLATDTLAAVEFLRSQGAVPISSIGVIGMSEGGRIAPIVATQSDELAFVVNMVGGAVPAHDALLYEEVHNIRQMGVLPGFAHLFAYAGRWSLIEIRRTQFWDSVGNFDPIQHWDGVTIPALVLYGVDDTNVPTNESVNRLEALGNPHSEVVVFEGSGHALETPVGKGISIIRVEVLNRISALVKEST